MRMKQVVFFVVVMGMVAMPVFATNIYWTNGNGSGDFGDLGNWNMVSDGSGNSPTTFSALYPYIDSTYNGAITAEISSDLSTSPKGVRVGAKSGGTGGLIVSGGTNMFTDSLRVGRSGSTGTFTMTGGTLSVPNSYTTFADGGTAVLTISGGVFNVDRVTFGQRDGDTCTLNMSGGAINVSTTDSSPSSSSGALRMGLGDTNLNISGTAVITAEKLNIAEGGSLNMNGGTVSITGSVDGVNPTFNFTEEAIESMLGKLLFNSGDFIVTGNYESLFDAAIGNGNIYTTVAGKSVDAQFSEGFTTLVLVPEPVTMVILGIGGLLICKRR